MSKTNCCSCHLPLPSSKQYYKQYGRYCRRCDALSEVTKKPNIDWFIELAKALKV